MQTGCHYLIIILILISISSPFQKYLCRTNSSSNDSPARLKYLPVNGGEKQEWYRINSLDKMHSLLCSKADFMDQTSLYACYCYILLMHV